MSADSLIGDGPGAFQKEEMGPGHILHVLIIAFNEYENFTTIQAYNNYHIIKISPQLNHRNYSYELITENYTSKVTTKKLY
jgi:hypothetical protein